MLIPALDLINGEVVRLYQGDFDQQTTYSSTPVGKAREYDQAGADFLHLVDLDGARDPATRQLTLINELTSQVQVPVQAGGGVRSRADVRELLKAGVQRVVVGSVAVNEPETVIDWLQEFGPERIVLALDVNIDAGGHRWLATQGWQTDSKTLLEPLLERFRAHDLRHVLCTDISRDGTMKGPNTAMYGVLSQQYPDIQWQASGGVAALTDIEALRNVKCPSVILGKALLSGAFTLEEALACWRSA